MKVYRSEKMGREIRRTYDALLRQWGVPVEEADLRSAYGSTHVIACGKAEDPPLVLFHGVGDDSALMWIYNAASLSRRFRVYAVDTVGGPGKSVPEAAYDRDFDDVLWIDGVLDALGIGKAFFAGVSHGGYLVQAYTASRPERVLRAASISGALAVGKRKSMAAMMAIFFPEALFPTRKNARKLIEKLSGENSAVFTGNETIMEHYAYLLKGFNNMAMGHHKVRAFAPEEVEVIRGKVDFLAGTADPFQRMGGADVLRENRMRVTFYENAGHGLNHERAEEINAKLAEIFLGT